MTTTEPVLQGCRSVPPDIAAGMQRWVHIPTPGDHYSPRTGSAVITVIREMSRCHLAAGGTAEVLVAAGTWDGFDDGLRREVAFRRLGTPSRFAKLFDRVVGGIVGRRLLSGRPYADAAAAIGPAYDGFVFVHNEPSGVEEVARRCPKAKVCLWVHNDLFRTYTRRQAERVVRYSHRIICVSNFIANTVRAVAGDDPKIVTVLNGVDIEKFVPADPRPNNDPPVILFLGRMVPEKGPDILLRAAIELKKRGVRFKLRMVGSQNFNAREKLTTYELELRRLAMDLGDSVKFHSFRPRDEVVKEYQSADILCVPSNWDEPLGLVVGEGMACGLAVIASRRGGIPEVGLTAVKYFSPDTVEELSRSINSMLSTKDLSLVRCAVLRAHNMRWVRQYDILARLIAEFGETTSVSVFASS